MDPTDGTRPPPPPPWPRARFGVASGPSRELAAFVRALRLHSGREERLTWGSRRLGSAVRLLPLRPTRPQMPPGGSGLSPRAAKSLCRLPAPRAAGSGAGVRGSMRRESSGPLHGITRKRCANKMQIKASRSSSEQRRCKFAFNFLPCVRGRLPGGWRRGRQGAGPALRSAADRTRVLLRDVCPARPRGRSRRGTPFQKVDGRVRWMVPCQSMAGLSVGSELQTTW